MAILTFPNRPDHFLDYSITFPQNRKEPDTLIVYLHGFASHQRGEKVLFFKEKFLQDGKAFLSFDHRGHGNSSGQIKDLTVSQNLEDLELIVQSQEKNFKKIILVGSSMGGQTSAWYARKHPRQVTANLLIAPGFRFLQNRLRDLGPEGIKQLQIHGEATIKNQWVELTIGPGLLEDAKRFTLETLIESYQTPTLILHGTLDDTVPFQDSVTFSQKAKAHPLHLILIGGGDHRLTDRKEELYAYMKVFCEENNF